jgi:hypothetical protein
MGTFFVGDKIPEGEISAGKMHGASLRAGRPPLRGEAMNQPHHLNLSDYRACFGRRVSHARVGPSTWVTGG